MRCPTCNKETGSEAYCRKCGSRLGGDVTFDRELKTGKQLPKRSIAIVAVLVVALAGAYVFSRKTEAPVASGSSTTLVQTTAEESTTTNKNSKPTTTTKSAPSTVILENSGTSVLPSADGSEAQKALAETPVPDGAQNCDSDLFHWRITWPGNWYTGTQPSTKCQSFDYIPLEGQTRGPILAIWLPLPLEQATTLGGKIDSGGQVTVLGGRRAVVVDQETSGSGTWPKGTKTRDIYVEVDGGTLDINIAGWRGDWPTLLNVGQQMAETLVMLDSSGQPVTTTSTSTTTSIISADNGTSSTTTGSTTTTAPGSNPGLAGPQVSVTIKGA